LYGHSHGRLPGNVQNADVGVDVMGWTPLRLGQIRDYMATLPLSRRRSVSALCWEDSNLVGDIPVAPDKASTVSSRAHRWQQASRCAGASSSDGIGSAAVLVILLPAAAQTDLSYRRRKKCPLRIDDQASMGGDIRQEKTFSYLWYIEVLTGSSGPHRR
jgi:hypothetical protein